jgi:hypothetical protein
LFKYTKREIFLEIFYFSIKTLNESASDYLKNLKKNCKYFSKLYYEEVIKLYKIYIREEDSITKLSLSSNYKKYINQFKYILIKRHYK